MSLTAVIMMRTVIVPGWKNVSSDASGCTITFCCSWTCVTWRRCQKVRWCCSRCWLPSSLSLSSSSPWASSLSPLTSESAMPSSYNSWQAFLRFCIGLQTSFVTSLSTSSLLCWWSPLCSYFRQMISYLRLDIWVSFVVWAHFLNNLSM